MTIYERPYGPEDLTDPPLDGERFIESLHRERAAKFPDPPALYQDLFAGKFRREDLQLWVKNMYAYWDHALVYSTGAIYIKTNDEPVRTHILRKMVDIEGEDVVHDVTGWTTPAYEELWLRFGEGLGLARNEIVKWKPFTRTRYAMDTLCMLSRWWEWSWLDGIASFYAGDLHGQEYLRRAYEVIQRDFEVPNASLDFFRVYLGDVATHLEWERDALAYWCCTRERQLTATRALRYRLTIEHQLLHRVHTSIASGELALQVP